MKHVAKLAKTRISQQTQTCGCTDCGPICYIGPDSGRDEMQNAIHVLRFGILVDLSTSLVKRMLHFDY